MQGLMIHTCDVIRKTQTQSAEGGAIFTDSTVRSDVPCRIQPSSETDIISFRSRGISITHTVYFASDPQADERCVIQFTRGSATVRLRVKAVKNFDEANIVASGIPNYWRAMCEEGTDD